MLDDSGTPVLTGLTEDQTTNGGQTVASFVGSSITDADSGAVEGIAIIAAEPGNGAWEYSTDNGGTWAAVGTVATDSALLLREADKIRFVPNSQASTVASLTYRAWDQTRGTAGTKVTTVPNGAVSAFSSATETASIAVSDVEDAPSVVGLAGDSSTLSPGAGAYIDAGRDAVVTDVDSTPPSTCTALSIVRTSGPAAGDFFSELADGVVLFGGDGIPAAGETVSVEGVAIGTVDGTADGRDGVDLRIALNASATYANLAVFLRNVKFTTTAFGTQAFEVVLAAGVSTSSSAFAMTVSPDLGYSTTTFVEARSADGAIGTTATITLSGDTFVGGIGDPLPVSSANVPAGLTAVLVKASDTTATLGFTGKATAHGTDVGTVRVSLLDGAFAGGSAAAVTHSTVSDIKIDFLNTWAIDCVVPAGDGLLSENAAGGDLSAALGNPNGIRFQNIEAQPGYVLVVQNNSGEWVPVGEDMVFTNGGAYDKNSGEGLTVHYGLQGDFSGLTADVLDAVVWRVDFGNDGALDYQDVINLRYVPVPGTPDLVAAFDSGASTTDNLTNVVRPTFSGTAPAGATVRLYTSSRSDSAPASSAIGTATAGADGLWTVVPTLDLAPLAQTITARIWDAAQSRLGSPSEGLQVTIATGAPAVPTIGAVTATTVSGTAEPGATVEVFNGGTSLGVAVADAEGHWSLTVAPLRNGTYSLTAMATDAAGNVSAASSASSWIIDMPAVATIARCQPGPVTIESTLEWRVTFTEAVTGVDLADFALTSVDGAATATLGTVTAGANAAEYFVTATGVTGIGTLRLDVKAGGTGIVDGSANALAAGFTLGQPYTHALGTVPVAWGDNYHGQLGLGSQDGAAHPVPALVPRTGALAGKTVVALAAGYAHSLALCSDGTVAAWGGDSGGQLGNPSLGSPYSSTPVAVDVSGALAGKTVVALAAGLEHSLALDSEGQVVAWGYNHAGQLGNGSTGGSATPVAVSTAATSALAGEPVVALAAGSYHSLALRRDGAAVGWGANSYGEVGRETPPTKYGEPVAVNTAAPSALVGRTVYALGSGCWAYHSLSLASPAAITAVATPAAGAYKAGDTLTFTLSAGAAVTVTGTPRLALTLGAATRYATYDAASSTGTSLVFTSTVQAGDTDADGLAVAGAIDLNGGTLTEAGAWPVALALPAHTLPTIQVDTTAPALSVVTLLSDNAHDAALAKAGDTVALSFRASETLQTPTVTLAGESATATYDSGTSTWTATHTVAAGDAEGAVTFAIVFSDVAGNAGTAVAATTDSSAVTIDLTAPETTIDSAPGAWTGPLVMFEFAGEDGAGSGVASYEVSVNGAAFAPATFREFFSDLPDGPYLLAVRAIDAAGNVDATPAEHRWTVDTLKPTLTAVTLVSRNAAPTLAKAGDTVTLSFRASEMLQTPTVTLAGESVTASYDSGTSTWTATHTVAAGDTEGAVTISIAYRDESGLAGTTVTATTDGSAVTIDLTAPETTIAAQPANPSGSASATFTFGSTDATASFEASLDGAAYAAATSPATFTGLADGPHTFAVRAIDSAGNVDATPASYAWTVATVFTAPVPDGFGASATGGAAGPSVVATTAAEFATYATSADAQVITVVGTLDIGTVAVASNKTIQGADASATLDGCLNLANVSNIVIRGLNLANPDGTALRLSGASKVYVTRCSFLDSAGPQFVATGSDQLTVSWCEFAATVAGQSAVQLGAAGETTTPRITLHHNWWSANLASALPAVASGQVHQYSNYLDVTGNTTGTAVSGSAQLLSEANVYVGTANPLAKSGSARLRALDNVYTACTGTTDAGADTVFTPSYSYTLLDRDDLATLLRAQAGNVMGAGYSEENAASASITATATTVIPGASATLTAGLTGATATTYQWRLNNAPLSGATGATYTISSMAAAHAGTYTVAVSVANGDTVVGTPTTLTLGTAPTPPPAPTPTPAKGGGGACGASFVFALGLLAALRRRVLAAA